MEKENVFLDQMRNKRIYQSLAPKNMSRKDVIPTHLAFSDRCVYHRFVLPILMSQEEMSVKSR